MTVIVGAASSRSSSRTKAPGRLSLTKLRHGSSGGQGPSSTVGGQPLAGADPKLQRDIKHRFEITRKLGSGTYGKVSLAYDHKTEREVAVKLIKKSAIENKQDLIRIRREIRIMSMLKHPNIIQIYEVFENKDKIILVMEYASGGELYDYVSKFGSLAEAEARRIFRQITSAVLYCHKHRVAHRDLKLENILLDVNSNAKIADFGLSNYFADKNLLHTFCGSPLYASPEIINGTPYHGPEVDCWSLGILLYTLVYGSMPFDGHDFNRMVRQIKRGAYYEPDTPSTASMLIRNMLRVNPERRADIDDIASHWWLNLEENMPVIQELPENQILDHTPLTERAEIMVVQDLADETDVFMEFGHLSATTRQKIEEFRRRRKEAEEYNENSPIKPPKAKKTDEKEMTAREKSLRHEQPEEPKPPTGMDKDAFHDPLERLRQLESRLQSRPSPEPSTSQARRNSKPTTPTLTKAPGLPLPTKKETPTAISTDEDKKPHFVSATEAAERKSQSKKSLDNAVPWKVDNDSLNVLMNQLLEQMDSGPVSMNLVSRVKNHPMYDQRPMVKELLESIIAAQPAAVRKETSKVIDQVQGLARKQPSGQASNDKSVPNSPLKPQAPISIVPEVVQSPRSKYKVAELPTAVDLKAAVAQKRMPLEERKWHSVEVGFETDEDSNGSSNNSSGGKAIGKGIGKIGATARITRSADEADDGEADDDEIDNDESEYESEIDELAEVVESIAQSNSRLAPKPKAPTIVESRVKSPEPVAGSSTAQTDPSHLSTLERGLAKRQSKGKYQHMHIEMYGRGVSTEANSPPPEKRKIGGPQPSAEQLPELFDKAKQYIMTFPDKPQDDDEEAKRANKLAKPSSKWTKSQDPDLTDKSATATPTPIRRTSDATKQKAKQTPTTEKKTDEKKKLPPVAAPESSGTEESEDEGEPVRKPRSSAIIGFRTIQSNDGSRREAPIVEIKPQSKPYAGINKVTPPPNAEKLNQTPRPNEVEENGKLSYETASQYIRRKSRERRARNFTIAYTEEAWQRCRDEPNVEKTIEPTTPTKSRASVDRNVVDSRPRALATIAAKVERRHSQLERRNSRTSDASTGIERRNSRTAADAAKPTVVPNDPTNGAASYRPERRQSRDLGGRPYGNDRRQSFHEYSPVEHDDFASVYGSRVGQQPPSSNFSAYGRFGAQNSMDEEVAFLTGTHYNPSGVGPSTSGSNLAFFLSNSCCRGGIDRPSSAYEPPPSNRFAVYQTRAEREAAGIGGSSGYRSTGTGHYDRYAERPASSYGSSGYRRPSAYDDRPLDFDQLMGGTDFTSTFAAPPDPNFGMGSRPSSRRLRLRERRNRSQSNDRKFSGGLEIDDRLMAVEGGGADFSYVAYHDTGNSRVSQPREPDITMAPARSILKNKQAYEVEPRNSQTRELTAPIGLRRHMSAEKDLHYFGIGPPSTGYRFGSIGPMTTTAHQMASHNVYGTATGAYFERMSAVYRSWICAVPKQTPRDVFEPTTTTTSKSRGSASGASNFLNMARRRTAEIRLGNDGKLTTTTNGYSIDDDYKRPRSPIDRIKSLFGGGKSTAYSANSNGAASRYGTTSTGTTAGTSSQFKRYTGATTNTRYGAGTRHWYD
ncbi:Protein kinase domain-containing protein [Aphelenchoides besseyi]|nr:Protein kinase domain-containing protein [Aphelenchoides besseyi]